jgi:hypothetical protein
MHPSQSCAACLQILIVMNTYTANLAAFLTLVTLQSGIKTVADLRGKAVVTIPIYAERLFRGYGVSAVATGVLPQHR